MKAKDIPIKSTWHEAIGPRLTNRRITNRIKQGFYGRIEQLRLLARSTDKSKRQEARKELKRFEGSPLVKQRAKRTTPIDISEFA